MAEQQEESSSLLDSAYDALDAQQHDHTTPQPSRRRGPEGGVSTPFGNDDDATDDLEKMSFLPPVTPHAPPPAASPPVPPPPTPPPGGDGGGSPAGRLFHNLQTQVAATQHLMFNGGGRDDVEVNNHVMGGETPSHAVSAPIGTGTGTGSSNNHNHAGGGAGDEDEASTASSATSTSGGSGSRRTRRKGAGSARSKRNGGQQQQGQPSVTITNYGTSSTPLGGGYQSSVAGTVNTPGKSNVPGANVTQLVFRLRVLNILLCTATLTVQILGLVKKIFNLTKLVLAGYVMFFALLLCCYEMHIPQFVNFLRDNFGILYTPAGRASFLILLGSTCLTQDFVTFVLGLVLIADGIFTFWVMYRYPEFRRVEEEVGREDATSLLAERVGIAHPPAWATPAGATAGDYGATGSGPSAAKSAGTGGGGEMLYDGTYSITGRVEGGAEAPILDFAQKKKVPWNACWPGKDERGGA